MTITLSTCGPVIFNEMFFISIGFFIAVGGLIIFEKYF